MEGGERGGGDGSGGGRLAVSSNAAPDPDAAGVVVQVDVGEPGGAPPARSSSGASRSSSGSRSITGSRTISPHDSIYSRRSASARTEQENS